jgi:TolB protein
VHPLVVPQHHDVYLVTRSVIPQGIRVGVDVTDLFTSEFDDHVTLLETGLVSRAPLTDLREAQTEVGGDHVRDRSEVGAVPDFSRGYVWAVYPSYDIFMADVDGSNLTQLTSTFGYDAEATFSPVGDRVIFTSMRYGDLDIYSLAPDGSDIERLTDTMGYDGGPFYSPDGSKIVYRAHRPTDPREVEDYTSFLAYGLIRPDVLEVFVMNANGSDQTEITQNGAANFGPYWHPSGTKIIFASNMDDSTGRDLELYMVNEDGSGLERITYSDGFDGFPVFSPEGRYLVWDSNRDQAEEGETNIFIAEWVESP